MARTSGPRSSGLPQRIQLLADLAGSVSALAERAGCSRKTLQNWLTKAAPSTRGGLTNLARNLEVSETWLIDGKGDPPEALQGETPLRIPGSRRQYLSVLCDVEDPTVMSFGTVSTKWLGFSQGLKYEDSVWWHATDSSMGPEIKQGEPVLLRKVGNPDLKPPGEHVFLVRLDGRVMLRAVSTRDKKTILLRAWHPNYSGVVVDPTEVEFLGELVWYGKSWDPARGRESGGLVG